MCSYDTVKYKKKRKIRKSLILEFLNHRRNELFSICLHT